MNIKSDRPHKLIGYMDTANSAWQTIGTWDRIEDVGDGVEKDMEYPKGTKVRLVMDLKLPVGRAFSLPGAEYLFAPFMPDGIELLDVYGSGSQAYVEGEVDPAWLLSILFFIRAHWLAISLFTIGISLSLAALISSIRFDVSTPRAIGDIVKWSVIGLGGLLVGIVGLKALSTFQRRGGTR